MRARADHRPLLEDRKIRTWYDENALRSKLTAEVNLRRLGLFCRVVRLGPHDVARLAGSDPSRLHGVLVRYAKELKEKGRLPSYIAKTFVGVKGWLAFNDAPFDRFPKLNITQGSSLRKETAPTQEELRRILSAYTGRGRVVALFMAHAGVRPGVLATIDASSGLTLGDIPDLKLESPPSFEKLPFHIVVPPTLSKTRVEYHTFGTPELADALVAYLAGRLGRGERLSGRSPVITVDPKGAGSHLREESVTGFITTPMMMRTLRRGLKAILPYSRTYVLRSYCSTQMVSARLDRDMREEILGHSLGVGGRYNLSKRLHPSVVEELRAEYAKAVPYLESGASPGRGDRAALLEGVVTAILRDRDVPEEKIGEILAGKLSQEQLERILGSKKAEPIQCVVPASELPARLAEGWDFKATVPGDPVVIQSTDRVPAHLVACVATNLSGAGKSG